MNRILHCTLAAMAVVAAAVLGDLANRLPSLALINESPSLPRGLYLRDPEDRLRPGSIVAVRQPRSAQPYLGSLGMPGNTLLLKRVAAVGGERVCASGGILETPRRKVKALATDRRGAGLASWSGCRPLEDDEVVLLGDTPSSFDSRYFGPVSRGQITGVYLKVMTW